VPIVCADAGLRPLTRRVCCCAFVPIASYRLPFVRTPYLLAAAQFDKWQLLYDVR
jgi:hypothetical protein